METIERIQENVFKRCGYWICWSLVSIKYPPRLDLLRDSCYFLTFSFLFYRDTVNSVGLIPRALPFTTSNTVVNTFRHAISLDERRAKFKANLWNRPQKHEALLSISDQKIAEEAAKNKGKSSTHTTPHHRNSHRMLENMYSKSRATPTDIDEVTIIYLFSSTTLLWKLTSFKKIYRSGLLDAIVVSNNAGFCISSWGFK